MSHCSAMVGEGGWDRAGEGGWDRAGEGGWDRAGEEETEGGVSSMS